MRKYFRKALIIFVIFYALFFSMSYYVLAITPGKAMTPGTPLTPGTPINPGTPIVPGSPMYPGDSITSGDQSGGGNKNGVQTNGPANPTQMPDGTVIIPNGDGTFTIYKPNKDGTYTFIQPNSQQYESIIDTYKNSQNSSHSDGKAPNQISGDNGANKNNQSGNDKNNANKDNEAKIDPWELGKFAIKDVGVNTAKYVNNLIKLEQTNESISTRDFLKENGKYKWNLTSATYKLATKGTFFEDINKEYDKYKGIYDNGKLGVDTTKKSFKLLNYYKISKNASLQGGIVEARSVLNLGPVSKFNAGVAAVGVVTSGIDMGININKAIHAKPGEERKNAIADSVGSLGDMLMSGGTIVTASGAGAAVGIGMIVIGGALKLGSVVYKNRKKIAEFFKNPKKTISNAVKTTVDKVKTFGSKLKKFFSWG